MWKRREKDGIDTYIKNRLDEKERKEKEWARVSEMRVFGSWEGTMYDDDGKSTTREEKGKERECVEGFYKRIGWWFTCAGDRYVSYKTEAWLLMVGTRTGEKAEMTIPAVTRLSVKMIY